MNRGINILHPQVTFGDFTVDCVSRADLVRIALEDCEQNSPTRLVFDINGHALSLARTDHNYRSAVQQADIVHADGGFLVTLSRRLRLPVIPERSATTDMIHDFCDSFSGTSYSFFLLGGEESVNSNCTRILKEIYPNLQISGRRNGFFNEEEEESIVNAINESKAEILWVGLGKPKEQEFCVRWKDKLNVRWIITCGGCFNYITGLYDRAPKWMQDKNLEWLYRMVTTPKLVKRYLITTPHALYVALRYSGLPISRAPSELRNAVVARDESGDA